MNILRQKNNPVADGKSMLLPVFMSVLVYAVALFIVKCNAGYIPIRLVAADMYVPVYYWLAFVIYTLIYSFSNKIKFNSLVPNMLILGIWLNIYLMLLQLNQALIFKSDYARIYLCYAFVLETVFFAANICLLCYFFSMSGLSGRMHALSGSLIKKSIYLYAPLAVNIAYQLYRDISRISIPYFFFHLVVLLAVCLIYRNGFGFNRVGKEKFFAFIRREKTILVLLFLFALFARIIFSLNIIHLTQNSFPTASDDGPTYHGNALLIAQNCANIFHGRHILPNAFDPGYSLFLGLIYKIFGPNFYIAAVIQSLLNALMVLAIYLITKSIFNRWAGVIAAILAALNQPLIMFSVVLTTEAAYIPLLVFSIYCLMKFRAGPNARAAGFYLFAGGIIMGLAIITRAVILLFPVVIVFLLLSSRSRLFVRLKNIGTFCAGLCLVLVLITALAYTNTGKVTLFTNKHNMTWNDFTDENDPRRYYSNAKLIEMGINPYGDFMGSMAIILKNPVKFVRAELQIIPARLKLFLFFPNFGYFDPLFILNATTPNQYASTMKFYALLISLIGITVVLIKKNLIQRSLLIISVILYYLFIHVVVNTGQCGRYRVPIHPFIIIFSSWGLYLFYKNIIRNSSLMRPKEC